MVTRLKKILADYYTDVCSVYEKKAVNEDGRTKFEKILVHDSIPCRLSAKEYLFGESAAKKNDSTMKVIKKAKVFLPPEYEIKPGSLLEITCQGRTNMYGKSGHMNFYASHNEVMVELVKDYA